MSGVTREAELWCMHVPGPSDIFAAPSREIAQKWADEHNAFLDRQFWDGKLDFGGNSPPRESFMAEVIPYPYDAASHANDVLTNVFAKARNQQ